MNVARVSWAICLSAMVTLGAALAADKLSVLQARFDRETNPIHRVKALEKLGDAEFEETRRAFKANDLVTVGVVLEKYRDNARITFEGLKKKHADAERQSGGYRQLEIHIRRGIREVDEILLRVPEQYQPPFQLVRKDLDYMDRELIRMLFRHRDGGPGSTQAPQSEPQEGEVKP
jgi:hypothetical protein